MRRAVAKSNPELNAGFIAIDEFKIVRATSSKTNNQLVELATVYTLRNEYGYSSPANVNLEIDEKIIYHQTFIVDVRSLAVVKVGEAVAGGDAPLRIIEVNSDHGEGVFDSSSTLLTENKITGNSNSGVLLARNSGDESPPVSGGANFIEGYSIYGLNCDNSGLMEPNCNN